MAFPARRLYPGNDRIVAADDEAGDFGPGRRAEAALWRRIEHGSLRFVRNAVGVYQEGLRGLTVRAILELFAGREDIGREFMLLR